MSQSHDGARLPVVAGSSTRGSHDNSSTIAWSQRRTTIGDRRAACMGALGRAAGGGRVSWRARVRERGRHHNALQLESSDESVRARAVEELCKLDPDEIEIEAVVQLIKQHDDNAVRIAAGAVLARLVVLDLQDEDEQDWEACKTWPRI